MIVDDSTGSAGTPARAEFATGKFSPGAFSLLLALVFGACLLFYMARDPFEKATLQKEMNRLRLLHDQQKVQADQEVNNLRAAILDLQQTLRDTQQELLMAQHALRMARKAYDETVTAGRVLQEGMETRPPERTAPPAIVAPAQIAAPDTKAERYAQMVRDLEAIQRAVRQNGKEYAALSRALAETKRSLALALGDAPEDSLGHTLSRGIPLEEWPQEHFLTEAELAAREAAEREQEISNGSVPSDSAALAREMANLNRTLIAAQERLSEGQKELGTLQDALRAALAH